MGRAFGGLRGARRRRLGRAELGRLADVGTEALLQARERGPPRHRRGLDEDVAHPDDRAAAPAHVAKPVLGERRVQRCPAPGPFHERAGRLDGPACRRRLARAMLGIALARGGSRRALLGRAPSVLHFARRVDPKRRIALRAPPLRMLNPRARPVQRPAIEPPVDLDDLARVGIHAIEHDVHVPVVGVGVQPVHHLVAGDLHLVEQQVDSLLHLLTRWALAPGPAEHVVHDRVARAPPVPGKGCHLRYSRVERVGQEAACGEVQALLLRVVGLRRGDVARERLDAHRLRSAVVRVCDLLADHRRRYWRATRAMAAWSSASMPAVCAL